MRRIKKDREKERKTKHSKQTEETNKWGRNRWRERECMNIKDGHVWEKKRKKRKSWSVGWKWNCWDELEQQRIQVQLGQWGLVTELLSCAMFRCTVQKSGKLDNEILCHILVESLVEKKKTRQPLFHLTSTVWDDFKRYSWKTTPVIWNDGAMKDITAKHVAYFVLKIPGYIFLAVAGVFSNSMQTHLAHFWILLQLLSMTVNKLNWNSEWLHGDATTAQVSLKCLQLHYLSNFNKSQC